MNVGTTQCAHAYLVSEIQNNDEQEQTGEEPEMLVEMDVQRRILQIIEVHFVEMQAVVNSTGDTIEDLTTAFSDVHNICKAISNDVKDICANIRFIFIFATLLVVLNTTIVAGVSVLFIYVSHWLNEELAKINSN